jgi:hypothetical protein
VRVPSDDEERETADEPPEAAHLVIWPEETEAPSAEAPQLEEPAPPPAPIMTRQAPAPPAPAASTAADSTPRWTLITVAGLAVWAEEAIKQIGPERLRILLDLCEFTGYLSSSAKEALLKVTSLGLENIGKDAGRDDWTLSGSSSFL